jgi:hypothetical protein
MTPKVISTCLKALFFLAACSPILTGQVIIREKISISPNLPQIMQSAAGETHSFLKFTYLRRSTFPGRIEVTGPCGIDTSAESPGNPVTIFSSTTLLIDPAPPGTYHVTVNTIPPNSPVSAQTVVIEDENGFVRARDLPVPRSFDHAHLYFTGYSLTSTKETIEPNQSNRFLVVPQRECLATRFSTAGPVTLRITEGMEFGQFYRLEFVFPEFELRFVPLGTEVTAFSSQLQDIDYIADGELPPAGSGRVIIQSDWNTVVEADTFFVQRVVMFDHFEVKTEPDTLPHGESASIAVTAKDAQTNDFSLDGNTILTLSLDSTRYGSFISPLGDTVSSPLSGILYVDAKAARIKFTANKTDPVGIVPKKVVMTVTKVDDENKRGEGNIFVKRMVSVKIADRAPFSIWPLLPAQSNGESRGADRSGYNPKRPFTILTRDGLNNPAQEEQVEIFTKYEVGTGGHGHEGFTTDTGTVKADKNLPQNLQGVFHKGPKKGNPLQFTSDETGSAKVDSFLSSQASGRYLITVRSKVDTTALDTITIQVKVPSLVEFGTGDYWTLTGTTSNRGKNHLSNHWCTQKTKDSLTSALRAFYEWSESEEGGGKPIKVGINDMSLESGGAFDIPGTWMVDVQHSFHRVGLSVDVDRSPGEFRKEDGTLTKSGERLKTVMEARDGKKYPEKQIHFGFDGGK